MPINYGGAVSSGRNLTSMGYEVERISENTNVLKDMIPSGYDGQDAQIYLAAVEQFQNELRSITYELKSIGNRVENVVDILGR